MAATSFVGRRSSATSHKGEDLVGPAFTGLIADNQLLAYRYRGFWKAMDTFRDKQELDELWASGQAPWEVWKCV